ncbi:MAG: AAC(3) family N-acetyltransferase [Planctomycetes bacterium]|nr:AAC(3) family N-acetyltransferase [Planctomycetota bacterium]
MSAWRTRSDLVRGLRDALGLSAGDLIAVHSSMKSLGPVHGGASTVIAALLEAVEAPACGTVLMPCFTHPLDEVDVARTPCRLGLIPETFRTWPGVRLSDNHTHRVAVFGREAEAIAASHVGTAPLGPGSPLHQLALRGGSVIHLGCDFRSCSLIHVAEFLAPLPFHAAGIAYPDWDKDIVMIRGDGTRVVCPPIDNPGDSAGFLVVQRDLERRGLLHRADVGSAACLRARGSDILDSALAILAEDPLALLCADHACPVCGRKRQAANAGRL